MGLLLHTPDVKPLVHYITTCPVPFMLTPCIYNLYFLSGVPRVCGLLKKKVSHLILILHLKMLAQASLTWLSWDCRGQGTSNISSARMWTACMCDQASPGNLNRRDIAILYMRLYSICQILRISLTFTMNALELKQNEWRRCKVAL